jgi:very-short-patch-repair endonuclease
MSRLSDKISLLIDQCFPVYKKTFEYYVKYEGEQLFFDFVIDELNIAIEVQGKQHYEFVPFFHRDSYYYYKQNKRDRLKKEWAEENGFYLVIVKEHMKLDKSKFLSLIKKAMELK